MPRPTWPHGKTLKFIEVYRSHEFLWDPCNKGYMDRTKRQEGLEEIAKMFDTKKRVIERKIMHLQTQFGKEIKKMKSCKFGGGEEYVPKWFGLKPLLFLLGRKQRHKWAEPEHSEYDLETEKIIMTIENYNAKTVHDNTQRITHEDSLNSEVDNADNVGPAFVEQKPESDSVSLEIHDASSNDGSTDIQINESVRGIKVRATVKKKYETEDEYAHFGRQVAIRLRKLNNNPVGVRVQHEINEILVKAELGKYNNAADQTAHNCTSDSD